MKKYYLASFFYIFSIICFNSCLQNYNFQETVTFKLPSWPPQEDSTCTYPELSRWLITVSSSNSTTSFFTTSSLFSLETQKNQPLSVTALPLTKLQNSEKETCFFFPAGAIYPYNSEVITDNLYSNHITTDLTWEQGYTASLMEKIINSRIETGVTSEHINDFLKSYNWKKLQNAIDDKINSNMTAYSSSENPEQIKFYNPWQIDTASLLDNLCYGCFSINSIQPRNTFVLQESVAKLNAGDDLFSSYVPENQIIHSYNIITLQKNIPYHLLCNQILIAEITGSSAKKLSVDFTYVPIFYSDL